MRINKKGGKELYTLLNKAMYGTIRAALIFWKNLSSELLNLGFELNPYDDCVANKIVDGSQLTVLWHVDDIKVSHTDKNVVTDFLEKLQKRFGKLKVSRGKEHKYLGMDMKFRDDGVLTICMEPLLREALDDFPEEIKKGSNTPAGNNLFEIKED